MLLYPGKPGELAGERKQFGNAGGAECLRIATVDVSLDECQVQASLARLAQTFLEERTPLITAAG